MPAMILAPCGIDCSECPAYLATQNNDKAKLEEVQLLWTANPDVTIEDLLCDGCHSERVSIDCRMCWIKNCVKDKGVETCAECHRYPCDGLEKEWSNWKVTDPVAARARLDARVEP